MPSWTDRILYRPGVNGEVQLRQYDRYAAVPGANDGVGIGAGAGWLALANAGVGVGDGDRVMVRSGRCFVFCVFVLF